MSTEKCSVCFKNYKKFELSDNVPGCKEIEDISCPYCGHVYREMTSVIIRTESLPESEQ